MQGYELQNAVIHTLTNNTRPINPNVGQVMYNTDNQTLELWDGVNWSSVSGDITSITITTGVGLQGGVVGVTGAVTGSISLNHLGLEDLVDPNKDSIFYWNDLTKKSEFLDIGDGLLINSGVLSNTIINNDQLINGSGYITADSSDTLTNKSGNISQWTNDVGYITDGNTNWNNTYGFITGISWDEITGNQLDINLSGFNNDSGFTTFDGDYNSLSNLPTIPTNNNQLINGAGYITTGNDGWVNTYGFITGVNWDEIGGLQSDINLSGFTNDVGFSTFDGDYNSLTNIPTYTQGSIIFADSDGSLTENNSQLYWDNVNNRLGIGTTSPQAHLSIGDGLTGNVNVHLNKRDSNSAGYYIINEGNTPGRTVFVRQTIREDAEIGTNNNNDLSLLTNDTVRLYIDGENGVTQGYVGIGTTTPTHKLTVNGDIRIGQNATIWSTNTIDADVRLLQLDSQNNINIGLGGGHNSFNYNNVFYVKSSGDVGIGITTPAEKLDVIGNIKADGILKLYDITDTQRIELNPDGDSYIYTKLAIGTFTGTPQAVLHIQDVNPRIIRLQDRNYPNTYADIDFKDGSLKFLTDPQQIRVNSLISFSIDNLERLRINYEGNVGIGTTSPTYKLELNGSTPNERTIGIDGDAVLYYPDQSIYASSIAIGDGLRNQVNVLANDGTRNVAIGRGSQLDVTTGNSNVSLGSNTLENNLTGNGNTAVGHLTMQNMGSNSNTAVGFGAMRFVTGGILNVALGNYAGYEDKDDNPIISVNRSVYIGAGSKSFATSNVTNEIVIGNDAVGKGGNTVVLGNDDILQTYLKGLVNINDSLRLFDTTNTQTIELNPDGDSYINGKLAVGRDNPVYDLHVNGDIGFSGNKIYFETDSGGSQTLQIGSSNITDGILMTRYLQLTTNSQGITLAGIGTVNNTITIEGNNGIYLTTDINRVFIDSIGRVGLSTLTPTERLDVVGNIKASGFINGRKCGAAGYLASPVSVTVTTANSYYPIGVFTVPIAETFISGVNYPNGLRYTGLLEQTFHITWNATIESTSNNVTATIDIQKNGVSIAMSKMGTYAKTGGEIYNLSGQCVVDLDTNDEVRFVVTADNNGEVLTFDYFAASIKEFFD